MFIVLCADTPNTPLMMRLIVVKMNQLYRLDSCYQLWSLNCQLWIDIDRVIEQTRW